MLKLRTPCTMMGIPYLSRESVETGFGELTDFLRSEGIRPVIQLYDPERHRYLTVITLNPPWGFALRLRSDKWKYMEDVERLKGIMVGILP